MAKKKVSPKSVEERKEALKQELIQTADEVLDGEDAQEPATPNNKRTESSSAKPRTVDNFERKGVNVGGPFSRRVVNEKKPSSSGRSGRNITQKIWEDREIKHVGEGTNSFDRP